MSYSDVFLFQIYNDKWEYTIGEVARREGGGENDISSVCLFNSPVVSHNGIGGVSDGREG